MDGFEAFRSVDFNWVMGLSGVFRDPPGDVPAIQRDLRDEFQEAVLHSRQAPDQDRLGWLLLGDAGSGKTHLLSAFRREAQERGLPFILIDMTGVTDFWDTVLMEWINSLFQPMPGGGDQLERVVGAMLQLANPTAKKGLKTTDILAGLRARDRGGALAHEGVVRALLMLARGRDEIAQRAHGWLIGHPVDDGTARSIRLDTPPPSPFRVVKGLAWAMGLGGPFVIAADQLDPIIAQHRLGMAAAGPDEADPAIAAIVHGIANGLMDLTHLSRRALVVVSGLESTWRIIENNSLQSARDRFTPPRRLPRIPSGQAAADLVRNRLSAAYAALGFTPPHALWPFREASFDGLQGQGPRAVLKLCHAKQREAVAKKTVPEPIDIDAPAAEHAEPPATRLDQELLREKEKVDMDTIRNPAREDALWGDLLQGACRLLLEELSPAPGITSMTEGGVLGEKQALGLHARIRLVFRTEGDREEHFSLRAIEQPNAVAFQNRLVTAQKTAGVGPALRFRRLALVRTREFPGGDKTKAMIAEFQAMGGMFLHPAEEETRTLAAVLEMEKRRDPAFAPWLAARKPISGLPFLQAPADWLRQHQKAPAGGRKSSPGIQTAPRSAGPETMPGIPVGRRIAGGRPGGEIAVPLTVWRKHAAILAGSGSGKTVLLRRLVEEAAIRGVPSIVIDSANDLARLGEPWPQPPAGWTDRDKARAGAYFRDDRVVIWTPGLSGGNPLVLEPVPSFNGLDGDERKKAILMVAESLEAIVAPGNSPKDQKKRGVLRSTLRYFVLHHGGSLEDLADLLADPPHEAQGDISVAVPLAREMADQLKAAMHTDPLLASEGAPLDPAVLFGLDRPGPARISVINLSGLPGPESQRRFVNQLAMSLFAWIKRHPGRDERPRGLLAIDEAKMFLPAMESAVSKKSLLQLTAQGRKYGLGLVFATQAPKDLDHHAIANCATQFFRQGQFPGGHRNGQEKPGSPRWFGVRQSPR